MARKKHVAVFEGVHHRLITMRRYGGKLVAKLGEFDSDKTFWVPLDEVTFDGTMDRYKQARNPNSLGTLDDQARRNSERFKQVHRTNQRRGSNK